MTGAILVKQFGRPIRAYAFSPRQGRDGSHRMTLVPRESFSPDALSLFRATQASE